MNRYASQEILSAIIGCSLVISMEGTRYYATLYDKLGCVVVQSLRHKEQDDAINELMDRWREFKASARHIAWSLTPKADSLAAIGA